MSRNDSVAAITSRYCECRTPEECDRSSGCKRHYTDSQPKSAAQGRGLWLSSKVGDWIWRELTAGRSVADVTRELAERVKEMEARRVAA